MRALPKVTMEEPMIEITVRGKAPESLPGIRKREYKIEISKKGRRSLRGTPPRVTHGIRNRKERAQMP